jgi:hypothetical protein
MRYYLLIIVSSLQIKIYFPPQLLYKTTAVPEVSDDANMIVVNPN